MARTRRRARRLAIAGAIVLALLLVAVLLLPVIAGSIARGVIARQGSSAIAGSIEVGGVHLSWTGSQRVTGLRLLDPAGVPVATLDASVDAGLLALAMGSRDLGEIRVSGSARLQRDDDGELSIVKAAQAVEPPAPKADDAGGRLPKGLRATIRIEDFDLEVTDGETTSTIADLEGQATIRAGEPLTVELSSQRIEHGGQSGGSLVIEGRVKDWSTSEGDLTTDRASVVASVRITDLPSDLARMLAGVRADLESALGPRFTLIGEVEGAPSSELLAGLTLEAEHASMETKVRLDDRAITLREPLRVRSDAMRLAAALPQLAVAIAESRRTLRLDDGVPVELRVESLMIPRHADGLDLASSELQAQVQIPGARGTLFIEGQEHALAITETSAGISLSPAQGLRVQATGGATLDGRDAGTLAAGVRLASLFDEQGRPAVDAQTIEGEVALTGVEVAIAQPFVASTGVDLVEAIGPTLDAHLGVVPEGGARRATIRLSAERASAEGSLRIADGAVRSGEAPLSFRMNAEPGLVNALMGETPDFVLTRGGQIEGTISEVFVPLKPEKSLMDEARAAIDMTLRGFAGRLRRDAASSILLREGAIHADTGGSARVRLDLMRGEQAFGASLDVRAQDRAALLDRRFASAGLEAELRLSDLPTALADDLMADTEGPALPAGLVGEAVGPTVSLALGLVPQDDRVRITGELSSHAITGSLRGSLDDDRLAVEAVRLDGTLRPRTVDALVEAFAPDLEPSPTLASRTAYHLEVAPLEIGVREPELPQALSMVATLDRTDVRRLGIVVHDEEAGTERRRFLGPVLIDGGRARIHLALVDDEATTVRGDAALLDKDESPLGNVSLSLEQQGASLESEVQVSALRLSLADRLLAKEDFLAGAFGQTLDMRATYAARGDGDARAELLLETPLARTPRPIVATIGERAIRTNKIAANWDLKSSWVNTRLLDGERVRLIRDTKIWLEVDPTTIPRAEADDGRLPSTGILTLIGVLAFETSGGEQETISNLRTRVWSDPDDPSIVHIESTGARNGQENAIRASGQIHLAQREDGTIDPPASVVDLTLEAPELSVELVDALANQGGLLTDLLGSTAGVRLVLDALSGERGGVRLELTSPRTTVVLRGRVRDGVFRARPARKEDPPQIQISSFPPELVGDISRVVPLIGRIEKTEQDEPAQVRISRLELPLDGDLRRLNARLTIDIGSATFHASELFAPVLSQLSWNAGGAVGRRLSPVELVVRDGVMRYSGVELPLGEFTIALDGEADLATRSIDAVVSIPLARLSEEFGADIQKQVQRALGPLGVAPDLSSLMVPLRVKGSMDGPSIEVASDRLIDNLRKTLGPENLLRQGLEGLLKGGGGG